MRLFNIKVLIFFFLLCFDFFADSANSDKRAVDYYSASDVSALLNKYFANRQLTLTRDEKRFIQSHFNRFEISDLFWPRANFEPLPEKWYEYSNIVKRENKREGLVSFIPYLVSFFSNIKKPSGNILPSTTIRDIEMLDKKSPFDKIVVEIAKNVDMLKGSNMSNVEDVSFYNLIFLFRVLNAYNNREDIEDVIRSNEAFLSDKETMKELFHILNLLQDDSDFLLHYTENICFSQQCGLHYGEYDCYGLGQLVYEAPVTAEWNGWFFNNVTKLKAFNFNEIPFFTEMKKYSFFSLLNPLHWFFLILSKMMAKPGLLDFVDTWQIDNNLLFFILLLFYIITAHWFILIIFLFYLPLFIGNFFTFIDSRLDTNTRKICNYVSLFFIALTIIKEYIINNWSTISAFIKKYKDNNFSISEFIGGNKEEIFKNCALVFFSTIFLLSYFYLCLVWFPHIRETYKKKLFDILFTNDILRIRRYVRNMRDFYLKIRDKNENIKSLFIKYLPQCSSLFDIDIDENESLDGEQKELFNLIYTDRKISAGDVPRFYFLFYKHKELLQKIIVETQYVGSYVNAAMLVHSGKFCIPKFRYSGDNYIKMQDVVHPYLIDGGVRNSFEIGEKETGIRNMIFSGSNGTGKTTFQFAVVDNIILAQSLGIACCSEYLATPFDKIISMSNAKTDLSEGLSGYTSEVEMVKDCLSYLSENKDKRILLISDEPLSTTDPDFADWIVEKIFRRIFSYPNIISFVATHFKSPKKIPGRDKHLHAGNFRFKIVDKGTSLENLHLLEHGEGDNLGMIIAKQRGLLDLIDINE